MMVAPVRTARRGGRRHADNDSVPALLDVAGNSARLRVMRAIGHVPPIDEEPWWDRTHPYWVVNDAVLHAMRLWGRRARSGGGDLRLSPFWSLLEHQDSYLQAYERHRHVELTDLTPHEIYLGLCRRNRLAWAGWIVIVGSSREVTDDFGQPAWEARIWASGPDASQTLFSGIKKSTARAIYAHIAGHPFSGPCSLGFDPPHPAENIPGWAVNEDGSLNAAALGDSSQPLPEDQPLPLDDLPQS